MPGPYPRPRASCRAGLALHPASCPGANVPYARPARASRCGFLRIADHVVTVDSGHDPNTCLARLRFLCDGVLRIACRGIRVGIFVDDVPHWRGTMPALTLSSTMRGAAPS